MSRSHLFVQGDGSFRHMIIDAADTAANAQPGETVEETPPGAQPAPGRQIFVDGDLIEN